MPPTATLSRPPTVTTAVAAKPAAIRTRTVLYTATGRTAPKLVDAEMKRLEAEHLRLVKRKLDGTVLFVSSTGPIHAPCVSIVAHTTVDQPATLQFLQMTVAPSPAAPSTATEPTAVRV